ncbi:ribonuclease T2 family protein [Qipengyuania spongiae]|uniref:Ribonuclease T n=1 Tax=Qipengyuania spongiae TaxID=2909673 RepID=A0ABY5SZD1_9SPHN|nr:ribonuclease T [Qipengyuania spongiae]UVI39885.1 ribonuclease T [Qipengyuania spongiae]
MAIGLTASVMAAPLAAQSYQCRMPKTVSAPAIVPDGPVRRLPVTGYTMALSWSPEFCRPREGQRAHALQCSRDNGRFGFVLHGFWPESARSWPQWCPTARRPTGAAIARQLCASPSPRLVARQWAKHGSCSGWNSRTYFRVSNILFDSLRFPDFDRLSRKPDLTAGDVRGWFLAANGGWRRDAIGVKLNARGWLEEVRLCYNRRFRPEACDRRRFGPADNAAVRIWRGL